MVEFSSFTFFPFWPVSPVGLLQKQVFYVVRICQVVWPCSNNKLAHDFTLSLTLHARYRSIQGQQGGSAHQVAQGFKLMETSFEHVLPHHCPRAGRMRRIMPLLNLLGRDTYHLLCWLRRDIWPHLDQILPCCLEGGSE